MPGTLRPITLLRAAALLVALGCTARAATNATPACLDHFDPGADYFPVKATIEAAQGFSVEYHGSYKVVTVVRAYVNGPAERYVLLQCGAPRPSLSAGLATAPVVRVPVKSMLSGSTTHLPLLVDLGHLEVLTGVRSFADVTSPPVLARIQSGQVAELGSHAAIDAERVVALRPDLLMTGGDVNATYSAIRAAGVPIVANVEWLETTPLGRAEWVKFMGLFLNEEPKATSLYQAVRQRYEALVDRARSIPEKDRPRVMTGRGSQGQFSIAGGRSYVARLIKDAGGRYVWDDDADTGTPLVDLEAQLRRAAGADVWINGGGWKDLPAMLADEPRYAEFKAFRNGQVWVYERRVNASGANDYWSGSVTRPDLVLADLIKILHPRLMPDHEFQWYLPVPPR